MVCKKFLVRKDFIRLSSELQIVKIFVNSLRFLMPYNQDYFNLTTKKL